MTSTTQDSGHHKRSNSNDAHTVVGDSIRRAGDKIETMSNAAADVSDRLVNDGVKNIHKAQDELQQYADTAIGYLERNPLKSAMIAGAIGLVLGKMLSK